MRGSSADQPRSSDDPAYQQPDVTAPRSSRTPSSGSERVPPPPANVMGSSSGGGDRPSGYQTEERYWTDYLRIALPIAGLLLLLSVFWFWASSFIGDDNDTTPTPVVAVNLTPQNAPTIAPTLQDAVVLSTPTTAVAQPTTQPTQPATEPTQPAAEPTLPPAEPTTASASGTFQVDDLVIVNDNDVNMRAEASTISDIVDTLTQGTELRILNSTPTPYTDDQGTTYIYWNVSDDAAGTQGWVVGDFLEK